MHRFMRVVAGAALVLALAACPSSPTGSVLSVTIIGGDRDLGEGATTTLAADVQATGAALTDVDWTSSDGGTASIDPAGELTAHQAGVTEITATSVADPTVSDRITVTVHPTGTVLGVTIDGGDRTLVEGATTSLTVDVRTTGDVSSAVTWSSSDADVGLVDADGNLAAVTAGVATITAESVADPAVSDSIVVTVDPPGTHRWTRDFGTSSDDFAQGIAIDAAGNTYATGYTAGALEGTNGGSNDAFVRSYDSDGTHRWTRQFGTRSDDRGRGVATDADGNVYVGGRTRGRLGDDDIANSGAFVRSFDSEGNERWYRGFGTADRDDSALAVATDAEGRVYAAGYTYGALQGANAGWNDAFVRSFDGDGALRWTRQFGTDGFELANAIATDADGNVYVAGSTSGDLAGTNPGASTADAFIRSYDANGNHRWTRQFGTSGTDMARGIATGPSGDLFVAGETSGDVFVRSYDPDGNLLWTREFGTSDDDTAHSIVSGDDGALYVSGFAGGALGDGSSASCCAFVRAYDGNGDHRWTRQFGTGIRDVAYGVTVDASGATYLAGTTRGTLGVPSDEAINAFVRSHGP